MTALRNGTPLQVWAKEHTPDKRLFYEGGYHEQISFVLNELPKALAKSKEDYLFIHKTLSVISTHYSKSVLLPVYHIATSDGTVLTMRGNFYDWKISVDSPVDVKVNFKGLFDPSEKIHEVYCEGFPPELVYGPYSQNKQQFTLQLSSNYLLFVFCWVFVHR